jgi:short-subunit dehydrogenase
MDKPVCAIIGVGPGNGLSFAKKFSNEGYSVALCSRNLERLEEYANQIDDAFPFEYDVTDLESPNNVFSKIRKKLGSVSVLIYNAGAGDFSNFDKATVESFQSAWEINARGLFSAVKAVLPDIRSGGNGNIVIIGATASLRGGINTVPFASAKSAQRSLAQSLAKNLGPEGIHVSYVIVDGVINLETTRRNMPDKPDGFFMNPDHIADSVYFLTQQKKTAWTFELDLRPFVEKW